MHIIYKWMMNVIYKHALGRRKRRKNLIAVAGAPVGGLGRRA
jgi:hypothetical protein